MRFYLIIENLGFEFPIKSDLLDLEFGHYNEFMLSYESHFSNIWI